MGREATNPQHVGELLDLSTSCPKDVHDKLLHLLHIEDEIVGGALRFEVQGLFPVGRLVVCALVYNWE